MDRKGSHNPETESVAGGHSPAEHLGSLKPPIYETSTFVFESAEEARDFFRKTYSLDGSSPEPDDGYIYSRLDSPGLKPAEERLAVWEGADGALIFNSGTAAIASAFFTFLRPGDTLLYSSPLYGGTGTLIRRFVAEFGVETLPFGPADSAGDMRRLVAGKKLALVFVETPSNPTNDVFDLAAASTIADENGALLAVDNTFLSPIWQRPLDLGAHLSIHSATKYLGGHSDLTAGAVAGDAERIEELRHSRYRLGTTASPRTGWLLARSLETLKLRVEKQTANATRIAEYLDHHPRVAAVRHMSLLSPDDHAFEIYKRQSLGPGAMISFDVAGGEAEAFRFLDALDVVRLSVSLGGTESLACHPWSTTHSTVNPEEKVRIGVKDSMIRFSVGIEHVDDMISDLEQALSSM